MELALLCTYCNYKGTLYVYSSIEAKVLKCPKCKSKGKELTLTRSDGYGRRCNICDGHIDTSNKTELCETCWKEKFGLAY